jgi:hypothetical protein
MGCLWGVTQQLCTGEQEVWFIKPPIFVSVLTEVVHSFHILAFSTSLRFQLGGVKHNITDSTLRLLTSIVSIPAGEHFHS